MNLYEYLNYRVSDGAVHDSAYAQLCEFQHQALGEDGLQHDAIALLHFLLLAARPHVDAFLVDEACMPSATRDRLFANAAQVADARGFDGVDALPEKLVDLQASGRCLRVLTTQWPETLDAMVAALPKDCTLQLYYFAPQYARALQEMPACPFKVRHFRQGGVQIYEFSATQAPVSLAGQRVVGEGNRVMCWGKNIQHTAVYVDGNHNVIYIGPGVRMKNARIKISGSHNQVYIMDQSVVTGKLDISGNESAIHIGANVRFTNSETRLFAQENGVSITIGNDCLIGECIMRTSDSHSIVEKDSGKRINPAKSIRLSDRVWVAQNIHILKGVEIAHDVVIGTGSTVVKSITEPYTIHAGNPARKIRENVRWLAERLNEDE